MAKDLHSPVNDKYGKAHLDKFMQILKLSRNTGPLRYEKEGGRRQRAKGSVAEQSSRWEREREWCFIRLGISTPLQFFAIHSEQCGTVWKHPEVAHARQLVSKHWSAVRRTSLGVPILIMVFSVQEYVPLRLIFDFKNTTKIKGTGQVYRDRQKGVAVC